ncbi:PQQ-binding-like beta-propeller repeat protein [Myceligenerans pegani]|uniref:PQQ-binding-like beta-propeller repeat protein n=1 Tax=Myceligenerans pegani TaxID=2776917 RepID=A0ABR9MST7_9MICO|nr:PQQ-binding-like beta-propeller repeat protein [Myceligenerans sp. TRM 65318]MBE1874442.1 PQQ-binding-like beta-propeller repeat protein [Myceligenerans sp. TRM 65318]MBE3016713.1 PQQ-binding-like beta-propeller repeat protein [Myceligenerans sp. TRM 65318]
MRSDHKLWRRATPRKDCDVRATVLAATSLHGVGRVPLVTPHGILAVGYDDQAKTFDYRLTTDGHEERWRRSFPMGSYAQSLYNADTDELCVPNSFTKYSALDPRDGRVRWEADLGSRIRSTAVAVGSRYITFIGNHILEFGVDGVTELAVLPGSIFFGKPVVSDGRFYSLAGLRRGDGASLALVCFERSSSRVSWATPIGRDYVVASDTAGPALDTANGLVVAGTSDGHVVAVDLEAGTIRWKTELPDRGVAVRSAPCVADGLVAVGTLEGALHLLGAIDGNVIRSTQVDPLGIWSTPAIHDGSVYVHGGAWLSQRSLTDLSVSWEVPIGFNAYSAPVVADAERILICGGDPPADGYLVSVSLTDAGASPSIESEYVMGTDRDFLRVEYQTDEHPDEIDLDLRHFGRTGHERMLRSGPRSYYWAGEVDQDKRYAEVAIYGRLHSGTNRRVMSFVIDTGSMRRPEVAQARALGDAELPAPATSRANSGGPVLTAVLAAHGKSVDPGLAEDAAQYMRGQGIDPHHIWRGGSARIIASSSLPLPEMLSRTPTQSDVVSVIEEWEKGGHHDASTQ